VARIEDLANKISEARLLQMSSIEHSNGLHHLGLDALGLGSEPTRSLQEVCIQITDGEHATPPRMSSGIPLATAKNVRDGYLDMNRTDFVDSYTAEKCWRRCHPSENDILMVCVGATTGRVCRLHKPPEMVIVRSVALLRPNLNLLRAKYFEYVLETPEVQRQIWSSVKEAAQPCLYLNKMAEMQIPVPSLERQDRISTYLDSVQSRITELNSLMNKKLTELDALMPSILDKAFKGEL
jgi:type I restriction enzyme S subunit